MAADEKQSPPGFAGVFSGNADAVQTYSCHYNVFDVFQFAFSLFVQYSPPTLKHTIGMLRHHSC